MKTFQIIRQIITKELKVMFAICVSVVIGSTSYSQQISNAYTNTITDTWDNQYSLQNFQGQKIWIVILPATQTSSDTSFIERIDSIATALVGHVKTIVVPSYEDGYYVDSVNTLINWYQASLDSSIIISHPLHTHKISGPQQDSAFTWLTHSSLNSHFDTDISGPGTMFFIDMQGNLFGIFGPVTMWNNQVLSMMLP